MAKDLFFYLVENDGRVRQIVNGVVTSIGKRTQLPHAPIGSREISIGWERSQEWWGNIRNFSLPLGFVFEGAKILRNDAYKFNVDRELYLLILRFVSEIDDTYYKDYYKYLYKGQLDFSTMNDKQDDEIFEINIMEGGPNKLLRSQSNTQFDIPFDDDTVYIKLDGIDLDVKANMIIADGVDVNSGSMTGNQQKTFFLPFSSINREGAAFGVAFLTQEVETTFGQTFAQRIASPNVCAEASANNTGPIDVTYKGKLRISCINSTGPTDLKIRFIKSNQLVANIDDYVIMPATLLVSNQIKELDVDITIPLDPGERLYLEGVFLASSFGGSMEIFFLQDENFTATFTGKFKTTYIPAFRPIDLYKKLCNKMGIATDLAISSLLETCTFFVTSGDGVRGLLRSVKTTFQNFFKAFSVYLMAGVSVENGNLYFEAFSRYFVRDSVVPAVELGESKDMQVKEATELYFSSIKVGHQEQSIEDVNGKYDFNGVYVYSSPQKTVTRELSLQSPYKAGPYEIEIKRMNLEGKTTTDDSIDNDIYVIDVAQGPTIITIELTFDNVGNFIIFPPLSNVAPGTKFRIAGSSGNNLTFKVLRVDRYPTEDIAIVDTTITVLETATVQLEFISGQVYELNRSIVVASGVPSPSTIFNVGLSPARILATWFPWIRSFLYKYDSDVLKFESSNRNADLVAGGIIEKADIPVSDMGTPIAVPYFLNFGTKVPISLCETLEDDPNKPFATIWNSIRYSGYLFNGALAPVLRGEQTYRLLLTNENDPTDLII